MSVRNAPGAELLTALISCQEAIGLLLMCAAICMCNQTEMQTDLSAGFNLPLFLAAF